jgi:ABC-type nickel/cobalt efflux system permease component RcnA
MLMGDSYPDCLKFAFSIIKMDPSFTPVGVFALLGLGLVFGLKHATEVDHVVAVSTIVSEHRNVWRAALVGALWGAGHAAALIIVGLLVFVFRVAIPPPVANWLEFGVALMIISLGVLAVLRLLRKRPDVHLHRHEHDGQSHVHIHFHEQGTEHGPLVTADKAAEPKHWSHSHAIAQIGFKPLMVGAMHGLAGSAALTLLVLTQIQSLWVGLSYLALFGAGSTLGMLLMSGLIGLPFALSARHLSRFNQTLQTAAGILSVAFGLWYAYAAAFRIR